MDNPSSERRRRILFVGMHTSIHVARWIDMAARTGAELHLFPVFQGKANENLRSVTLHEPAAEDVAAPGVNQPDPPLQSRTSLREQALRIRRFRPSLENLGGVDLLRNGSFRLGESINTAPLLHGPGVLASVIRYVKPDLIHSLEFQHSSYLVLKAKEHFGSEFPAWLATNWGSDIYFYKNFDDHRSQLQRLLSEIDLYSCECQRDIREARDLGYTGSALPVLPNSGGFDVAEVAALRSAIRPSNRRLIMIKGYQHFAGRAMTSLAVLEKFADRLKDYKIVLYSVSEEPYRRAQDLVARGKLNIQIIGYATHQQMLGYFARARIYMGISISDAISTSVLESMAAGTFPIQTNTSCCSEWFKDGEGGFIVPPDNFDLICRRFETALEDDALVDRAADLNWEVVKARLDSRIVEQRVTEFYRVAFDLLAASSGRENDSLAKSRPDTPEIASTL